MHTTTPSVAHSGLTLIGRGRLGTALADALRAADVPVIGPVAHDAPLPAAATAALLCVPDDAIAAVAAMVPQDVLIGHCSGATGLGVFGGRDAFSLHPLMTVTAHGARFGGVSAAIDGTTPGALAYARDLAGTLGMRTLHIAPEHRAAYHAAASLASNFLVTVECAAERLAATAGVRRDDLLPLVHATVANWAAHGPGALTGPVARGDEETVSRQRDAVREHAPELLHVFDALTETTRMLTHTAACA